MSFVRIKGKETHLTDDAAESAPKRDSDDTKRHIRRHRFAASIRGRARRLGRLCQGHLHRHGGDDAFGPGGRGGRRQTGFMHAVVEFAKPFRMPDFFLISGLFLAVVIDRDWRTYLDRKVVHFAYFYVLWVTIQFGFKAPCFRRRDRLGPCRLPVSGILHRAVRHAVVHLSAAGVLRRHKTDTQNAAARDLVRRGRCWRWRMSRPAGP